jgi:hypothetical protein
MQKFLKSKGIWCDGFDDLTGEQVDERIRSVLRGRV